MNKLSQSTAEPPKRVVVIGSGGFIGSAAVRCLKSAGMESVGISRNEVDLLRSDAATVLTSFLAPGDAIVVVAARAPCRDGATLVENISMAESICGAIGRVVPSHLVYVSSDAVYRDSNEPLTESSCAEPGSLHGAMHIAREQLLRSAFRGPYAIVRPTLVYGSADPHNGYGPNRFRRLAQGGKPIVLFGNGEEMRDHVSIHDVGRLISGIVHRRSTGTFNAVSGEVASFREIAEFVSGVLGGNVEVHSSLRTGPMPHNGFRAFDASAIKRSFPGFEITPWKRGVAQMCGILQHT